MQLVVEDWWVGDRESYLMLTPSLYNIDAWEETDLQIIEKANLLDLLEEIPALALMARKMDNRNTIASQRRLPLVIQPKNAMQILSKTTLISCSASRSI